MGVFTVCLYVVALIQEDFSPMMFAFCRRLAVSVVAVMIAFSGFSASLLPMQAHAETWRHEGRRLWRQPIVRQAAVGAAAGAAVGVVTNRPIGRSVGIGALTGAGTGAIDQTGALRGRPVLRHAAKGAVVGTGTSAVLGRSKWRGAAVGAAAGAGVGLIRQNNW